MEAWAKEAKFLSYAITDDGPEDVTVERLNKAFTQVLDNAAVAIEHLIIHFVGHGVARDADDQFLLLSHWWTQPMESIKVSKFMRLLQYYQPKRVSLFVDACRSRQTVKTEEIDGSGILFRTHEEPQEFEEDRFRAAPYGQESYMVYDNASGSSFCLFSTVLVSALCGRYKEAVSTREGDRVVASRELARAIGYHYPEEAKRFGKIVTPSLKPGFLGPNDIYTRLPIRYVSPEVPDPSTPQTYPSRKPVRRSAFPRPLGPSIAPGRGPEAEPPPETELEAIAQSYQLELRPTHFETEAGCAVIGAMVASVPRVTRPIRAHQDKAWVSTSWWALSSEVGVVVNQGGSLLIQLHGGQWIGAGVVPKTIVTLTVGPQSNADDPHSQSGAISVIYRLLDSLHPTSIVNEASKNSQNVIAMLRAGRLAGREALNVAAKIRTGKHIDPMLGVIAAYLYDSVGDRDSIRRIAYFFAASMQPIPFDVALLADLQGVSVNGRILADIPEVSARSSKTEDEALHQMLFQATPAITAAPVSGGFPWLRQGWDLLETAQYLPVHPSIIASAKTGHALLPFPFTTLSEAAGAKVADLIDAQLI